VAEVSGSPPAADLPTRTASPSRVGTKPHMRVLCAVATFAAADVAANQGNPIRRVVSMLQSMQEKIEAEAERDEKMFAKFQCFCDKNSAKTSASIEAGKEKIEQLEADIPETKSSRDQTISELQQHKDDREAAKQSIGEATSQRKKENQAFQEDSANIKGIIDALGKAIPAIEKGMMGFLQTPDASTVLSAMGKMQDLNDEDKATVTAFFQGTASQPSSGEVVGILKTMKEENEKTLDEITGTETESAKNFEELVAAKKKEIAAATEAIEEKTERAGEMSVKLTTLKNDLDETQTQLEEDTGYSEELSKNCKTKAKEYDEVKATRAEELLAIADTIKVLNSDDALELFKKTLPGPSSLLQVGSKRALQAKALAVLEGASKAHKSPALDLIVMALRGKKGGFEKVTKLIDDMVKNLKKEQTDDDAKKAFCGDEIDQTEDKQKELKNKIHGIETHIEEDENDIESTTGEIKALREGIKDLDKSVAEATAQRKAEHEAYVETAAQNNAALELLEFAKNRLNKVYHPEQYKEESFVQIRSHVQTHDEPEAFGAQKKQNGGGVIGMLDKLRNDLKLEMNEDKLEENDAQSDYEKLMADSAAKRASDSKALTEKEGAVADATADLTESKAHRKEVMTESQETDRYMSNLHATCDWLQENFDTRKQARTEEIESLEKAKAVLAGADFSLAQKA